MDSLDFLTAVLPSTGVYCACELTSPKREHFFLDSPDEVHNVALLLDKTEKNAYFALATFEAKGTRAAANARLMRSLFVDVDCGPGKAYPTKRAGVEALNAFLESSRLGELGNPWVVDSGGGIHAYWPLTEDTFIAVWKPVAEGFKRLCAEQNFHIDMTVTADAARVLRMPGTTNWKYPKPVNLRLRGDIFQLADIERVVRSHGVAVATPKPMLDNELASLPGAPLKREPNDAGMKLLENTATRFKDIMIKTVAGKGCGQIKHYVEHAQEDGMEPLWRGILSIAKVCEDGIKSAQKISAMHPYDDARLLAKWNEIKGPYPCTKFDSENPGICPSCQHWGKITNPLRLGASVDLQVEEKVVEVVLPSSDPDGEGEVQSFVRPKAPNGFGYGPKGGVYREVVEEDPEGNKIKVQKQILPYEMFLVDVLNQSGTHSAQLVVMRHNRCDVLNYPMRAAASKDDTIKYLAEHNVIACYGQGNDKHLFDYVRACAEEASTRREPTVVPSQYGWQEDGSFVHNGTVYFPDGIERPVPMPGLENITRATRVAGTLEGWRKIISVLDKRGLNDLLAHVCIGFGSPLMRFSGIHGMTFHAGHKESGTGKSLTLDLCASIWGSPLQYRIGQNTSQVAMQQRAGLLNGLPFTVDEITVKARDDSNWFPSWAFTFSEGKGKERMESGTNRERVNNTTWYGLALFTSNTFMLDIMTGMSEHSAEGEIRRFLEWNPGQPLTWSDEELSILRTLDVHYGVAGEVFAKWLVRNRAQAESLYRRIQTKLFTDYHATNDERFWIAGCAAVLTGATLCGSKFANVYDFDVKALHASLYKDVLRGRDALRKTKRSAEDVLNAYIRDYYGNLVVIEPSNGTLLASLGNGSEVDKSITRSRVLGRVEKEVAPSYTDFYVEEKMMKRHCASLSFGYDSFVDELAKSGSSGLLVERVYKNMLSGTRGPQMRVQALRIRRPTAEVLALEPDQEA